MAIKHVLLWIEAPLQSWGCSSKFGPRSAGEFPTKSGIYGMILAGLGLPGKQIEFLKEISRYHQTVISYKKSGNQSPKLIDFQMVGNGYDSENNKEDNWYSMNIPKKLDGGSSVGGGSKMVFKHYLQNAVFAVIQEADDEFAEQIKSAMTEPVFDVFFGRKNCIPTDIIFRGIFDSIEEAKNRAFEIAEGKRLLLDFEVSEVNQTPEEIVINDVPLQFGERKKYRDRKVFIKRYNGDITLINQS